MRRKCFLCQRPLKLCFGFCLGRDVAELFVALREQRSLPTVHELCGVCVEAVADFLYDEHGGALWPHHKESVVNFLLTGF